MEKTAKRKKIFLVGAVMIILILATLSLMFQTEMGEVFDRLNVQSPISRPNIILITMDTTRLDHLSCYGYKRLTSKNLDALAKEGLVFKNVISNSSWTYPSHASLMTGMYPISHGAHYDLKGSTGIAGHAINRFADSNITLAQILRDNGYKTIGIIGGIWLKRQFGLNKGFEVYEDDVFSLDGLTAEQIHQLVREDVTPTTPSPFFLFINYFDPHTPYSAPEPFDSLFDGRSIDEIKFSEADVNRDRKKPDPEDLAIVLAKYDAEIAYMDHYMGKLFHLLKQMGVYDTSWIIITADHGESFGEHDYFGHGCSLDENLIHVPLIMKYPKGWTPNDNVDQRIQLMDIMPTVLKKLGIPIPDTCQGQPIGSVSHPIVAELHANQSDIATFGERFDRDLKALYEGAYKFIWSSNGKDCLYDLGTDPTESHNLATEFPKKVEELSRRLDDWANSVPKAEQSAVTHMDDRTLEQLKALGYLN